MIKKRPTPEQVLAIAKKKHPGNWHTCRTDDVPDSTHLSLAFSCQSEIYLSDEYFRNGESLDEAIEFIYKGLVKHIRSELRKM